VAIAIHPLDQFKIEPIYPLHIGGVDASFTNSSLFMAAAVALTTALVILGSRKAEMVPGRWQSLGEMAYEFIADMIDKNIGPEGKKYFPFIFTLFMFVLFGNLLGMIPYAFTFTSHIVVTFAMAIVIFIGVTVIGIFRHGLRFLTLFVPHGVPKALLVLLIPIELLSYLIRPLTLSIRLFANMLAGHTMLAIFASFVVAMGLLGVIPLAVDIALMFLELLVAVLQAYVFAILTSLYLRDAIYLH
jgi:F-type H+-transporting ATPase subunit a